MNSILFSIGPINIYWYSVLIIVAIIIGLTLAYRETDRVSGIGKSFMIDLTFYLIIFGILGARLYYVIFNFDLFKNDLLSIFKIWEGGLAIYGAIIASIIVIILSCIKRQKSILKTMDILVPSLILGQAIGRWGNFFNQEAYGSVTNYEFLSSLHLPEFIINGMYIGGNYYHPTFLYESIWCVLGFVILIIIRHFWKNKKVGTLTFIYFIWYGIGRFFIEQLRLDSLYWGDFRISQIVSIILIIIGIIGLIVCRNKEKYKDEGEVYVKL